MRVVERLYIVDIRLRPFCDLSHDSEACVHLPFQVEFSLLRQLPETSALMSRSKELGIGTLAYSPLAMGRLTGKYSERSVACHYLARQEFGPAGRLITACKNESPKDEVCLTCLG